MFTAHELLVMCTLFVHNPHHWLDISVFTYYTCRMTHTIEDSWLTCQNKRLMLVLLNWLEQTWSRWARVLHVIWWGLWQFWCYGIAREPLKRNLCLWYVRCTSFFLFSFQKFKTSQFCFPWDIGTCNLWFCLVYGFGKKMLGGFTFLNVCRRKYIYLQTYLSSVGIVRGKWRKA